MRGILMMLGVVLHSAQVFNPENTWHINSQQSFEFSAYLVHSIHVFRMPAFFIISGYFCLLTISRYGPEKFLNIRLKRILIPLITTAVIINSIQALILNTSGWNSFNLYEYLRDGLWVSHLWFLNNLVVYFIAAYFVAIYLRKPLKSANQLSTKIPFAIIMALLPLPWILIKIVSHFGFPLYAEFFGVIKIYNIFIYAPYFIFGVWLRGNETLLQRFSNINPVFSILVIALSYYIKTDLSASQSNLQLTFHEYFDVLGIWFSTSLCFNLFMRFTNKYSKTFFFLSDASYSVFLFHQVFVIGFGILLIQANIGGPFGLILLISMTTAVTFFIHHYIVSKFSLMRYLFNGK